jgi:hypothetical protein
MCREAVETRPAIRFAALVVSRYAVRRAEGECPLVTDANGQVKTATIATGAAAGTLIGTAATTAAGRRSSCGSPGRR